jgi:Mg2+/Co2+ transporter CorC
MKKVLFFILAEFRYFKYCCSGDVRIGLLLVRQLIAKHRSFKEYKIEVVLLGPGITNESILRSFFSKESPKAVVVQHYGGGSGLLMSEINLALVEYNEKGSA